MRPGGFPRTDGWSLVASAYEMLRWGVSGLRGQEGTGFPLSTDGTVGVAAAAIADPLFQEMGAEVTFEPVMNLDDLRKGLAALRRRHLRQGVPSSATPSQKRRPEPPHSGLRPSVWGERFTARGP
ncbi:hypothetical protein GCM10014713_50290 [Streptomyces purpureus]|uniref:Uncharacterized protein n=1 Tax=Streptomyces purpureus TaxID=1951 RepID=A0A918HCC2_9ACTN|nr:hypothetical protein GCM10014713_50290 [Streptomyces purpureus]